MILRTVTSTFLTILLAVLAACAPTVMKGYPGPVLPDSRIARIETGAYTAIEAVDGLSATSDTVDVLPGNHTIVVRPLEYQQPASQYWFYSMVAASVNFVAEPGHSYQVHVEFVVAPGPAAEEKGSGFRWVAYVVDRPGNLTVAKTDLLPLEARPRIPSTLRATGILGIER